MKMKTFVLLDASNLFFRSKHMTKGDIEIKKSMALHICFTSILKVFEKFNGDHLVICLEGSSWRKTLYPKYKLQRKIKNSLKSEFEIEEDEIFNETFNDFTKFLKEKTNVTVLQSSNLEADDLVSIFIRQHPNDKHVIISSDKDFYQLLSSNVSIYNGINEEFITINGCFDDKNNHILNKNGDKKVIDPKWELFLKCIRGDTSDNIFSAYPRVNEKKIRSAYDDYGNFCYNNFMYQKWKDHNGEEKIVKDEYERNKILIDLNCQPKEIVLEGITTIQNEVSKEPINNIFFHFTKFCNKHSLNNIKEYQTKYLSFLIKSYK